jgi:hypothetical protein
LVYISYEELVLIYEGQGASHEKNYFLPDGCFFDGFGICRRKLVGKKANGDNDEP